MRSGDDGPRLIEDLVNDPNTPLEALVFSAWRAIPILRDRVVVADRERDEWRMKARTNAEAADRLAAMADVAEARAVDAERQLLAVKQLHPHYTVAGVKWCSTCRATPWPCPTICSFPAAQPEPAPEPKITAQLVGGPWAGPVEMDRIVGPVFAVGHPIGNHYWLDTKSDPPAYHWYGSAAPTSDSGDDK